MPVGRDFEIDMQSAEGIRSRLGVLVDPNNVNKFVSDPSEVAKAVASSAVQANAARQNMTPEEYVASRGGINSSGYFGDSYNPQLTLNPLEYKAAKESGGAEAINAAARQKNIDYLKSIGKWPPATKVVIETTTPAKPVTPTPITPTVAATVSIPITPPVKTAPIDTILFNDETVPIEVMTDLIFENIGGHELINIARNDTVNGQKIIYQPIKNLNILQQQYSSVNLVGIEGTSDTYFKNFSIKMENKIPNIGNGPNGENVYIDPTTGDLVIEAVNLQNDEQIEIQILVNGTIYEAELGG